jgi:hypothetical protein
LMLVKVLCLMLLPDDALLEEESEENQP